MQISRKNYNLINHMIAESWNKNVYIRAEDIINGTDKSYVNVIEPWVINEVLRYTNQKSKILDIGCGCGYLTNSIYNMERTNIEGIDISENSINYAKKMFPNIYFSCQDVCLLETNNIYDLCISVMVLNNLPDIRLFFCNIYKLLNRNGRVIITIPHPCFWPDRHVKNKGFDYMVERDYRISFATKGRKDYLAPISYFHRPVEIYASSIKEFGFKIEKVVELLEEKNQSNPDILGIILSK